MAKEGARGAERPLVSSGKHKPASPGSLLHSTLFQAALCYYRHESVNYLSSIVLNAKLAVIHSGLDVVRVGLRRKHRDLQAAVHGCAANHIWYSPQHTWLADRMPAVRCAAAA